MSPTPALPTAETPDEKLVRLWLHGRSAHTIRAYRRDVGRFMAFVGKPLDAVTLDDLQAFADTLTGADSSRARVLAVVKSLLSFAAEDRQNGLQRGRSTSKPRSMDRLAERILDEDPASSVSVAMTQGRDHVLVRLLYAGGFRVSEASRRALEGVACASDGGAFVTVFGKGAKTRTVRVSAATARVLSELRGETSDEDFVFAGRVGHLDTSQAWRIVRKAAKLAGIDRAVSPALSASRSRQPCARQGRSRYRRSRHARPCVDSDDDVTPTQDQTNPRASSSQSSAHSMKAREKC